MRLHPSMRRRRAVPAARIARERGFGVSAGFAVASAGNGSPSVVRPRPVAHPWRSDGQARDSSKGFISVPLAPSCRHGTSLIHFQEDDQHVRSIKTPKQPQQSHRPLERINSKDLSSEDITYSYFLIRNGGEFIAKRREGSDAPAGIPWTPNSAIMSYEDRGDAETAKNVLVVEAGAETVRFFVNGEQVSTLPRAGFGADGDLRYPGKPRLEPAHQLA